MEITAAIKARFWSKVVMGSDCCWEWDGAYRAKDNYGAFTVGRKTFSAPRFAYEMEYGPIPEGLLILHSCDNRKCIRPEHLEAGTQAKNIKDCVVRGRHVPPKGEKNGMSKLTAETVAAIRAEYDGVRGSMTALSKKYGVGVPSIHNVIRRRRWK